MLIAGVDEAGRGPLAGPVVAAAVILNDGRRIRACVTPSCSRPRRARGPGDPFCAIAWAVGESCVAEIDSINIFQATLLAMRRAIQRLTTAPEVVWIDGQHCPQSDYPMRAIVDGDRLVAAIAAASIIAKTTRDALLVELDRTYPLYGFARHKGYSTPEHLAALATHGPCDAHRRTIAPVMQIRFVF